MLKLYSADSLLMAEHVRSVLSAERIDCVIKNQYLTGGIGELPPLECLPEVWLLNPSQQQRAQAILAELLTPTSAAEWVCPACNETIEGQFGRCWNCGQTAPDDRLG